MPTVALYNIAGEEIGKVKLSDEIFAQEVNEPVLHSVVTAYLANQRQGTQSALTRAEVRGGGIKPWRQKGTGRARQGSTRSPQWRHGGVVFAPKPRDYSFCIPRKVRRLAMKSALTTKVVDKNIIVLDKLELQEAKTKIVAKMLKDLGVAKKALLVLPARDEMVIRAAGNIEGLKTAYVNTLNVLDILNYEKFIVTQEAVKLVEEVYD